MMMMMTQQQQQQYLQPTRQVKHSRARTHSLEQSGILRPRRQKITAAFFFGLFNLLRTDWLVGGYFQMEWTPKRCIRESIFEIVSV